MVMGISGLGRGKKKRKPIKITLEKLDFIQKVSLKKSPIILDFEERGLETKDLVKIIDSIPRKTCKRVHSLNLNCNDLEKIPNKIAKFKNLCDLHLSVNPLKELNPKIKKLKKLEVIWLCETPLTTLPEESILKIKNLSILHLGEHVVLSNNFVKNINENVQFTFDGEKGEKDFLEKRDEVKK